MDNTVKKKSFLVQLEERRIKFEIDEKKVNLEELRDMIQMKFNITDNFRIEYEDRDFGEDIYVELENINDIHNFGKLRLKINIEVEHEVRNGDAGLTKNKPTLEGLPGTLGNDDDSEAGNVETLSTASTESYSSVIHSANSNPVPKNSEPLRNTWHLTWELPEFPEALVNAIKCSKISSSHKDLIISILYTDIYPRCDFYPKNLQYNHVISVLLEAYPKLSEGSSSSVAFEYWKRKLRTKFKNFRDIDGRSNVYVLERKMKRSRIDDDDDNVDAIAPKRLKLSLAWGAENYLPEFPPGESEETAQKYKELIQKALKERNPDLRRITEYMERSFAQRRREIVLQQLSCNKIVELYPCLSDRIQLICEFKRVMGKGAVTLPLFKESLREEFKPIKALFLFRKKKCIDPTFLALQDQHNLSRQPDEYADIERKLVIYMIPILLREEPSSFLNPSGENIPAIYIRNVGTEFELVVEDVVISGISDLVVAVYLYILSFYVFNLKYQKSSCKTEEFFQRKIFKITDNSKPNSTVTSLMVKCQEFKSPKKRQM